MPNPPPGFPAGFPDKLPSTATPESITGQMDFFMEWLKPIKKWNTYADWSTVSAYEQALLIFSGMETWVLDSVAHTVTIPSSSTVTSPLSGGKITINSGVIAGVTDGKKLYLGDVEFPLAGTSTKSVGVSSLADQGDRRTDRIFLGTRIGNTLLMRSSSVPAAYPSSKIFDARLVSSQDITSVVTVNFTPTLYDSDAYTYDAVNDDVTILTTGRYLISFTVAAYLFTTAAGSVFTAYIQIDTGSGFVTIDSGRVYGNMDPAYILTTGSMTRILELNSGDKLRIRASRFSGTQTIYARTYGTAMTITRVG